MTSAIAIDTAAPMQTTLPLVVDLDLTLVRTDTLAEGLLAAIRSGPSSTFACIRAARKGRASLKQAVAACAPLDPATFPYNEDVLALIRQRREAGSPVILATAADQRTADAIASHLGCFDAVIASNGQDNLKGDRKAKAILAWLEAQGLPPRFEYVGDCAADLPIWKAAACCHVARGGPSLLRKIKAAMNGQEVLGVGAPARTLASLLKAMRPHQWAKNLLVFLPAVFAQRILEPAIFLQSLAMFASLSLLASAIYIINDLIDIPSDRAHPSKRRRPFASGDLSVLLGPPAAAVLSLLAFATALLTMPPLAWLVLVFYGITTTAYSFWLKRKLVVDVLVLAGLYTLRPLAGAAATGIALSHWLLAFCIFFFFSLAMAKRYTELHRMRAEDRTSASGRAYQVADMQIIPAFGAGAGVAAVLVFAQYLADPKIAEMYANPLALWAICPLLLYWLTRLWFIAGRGDLHDDPVVFAFRDNLSRLTGLATAVLMLVAMIAI